MRRPYYNKWTFHHGEAALPDANPDVQLSMAVYHVPTKITTWTHAPETDQSNLPRGKSAKKSRWTAILLILFVVLLLAFAATLITWGIMTDGFDHSGRKKDGIPDDDSRNESGICLSDDCAQVAGDIIRFFDKTVHPCDDFYQFACGKYPQEVAIPRDKDKTGTMDQMEHKIKMQLRATFETPINASDSATSKLVKRLYRLCKDVDSLQIQGLHPLKKAVDELGGWPAGGEHWNQTGYAWEISNADLRSKYGVNALMFITVEPDFKNKSKKLITIDQPDPESLALTRSWRMARARGKSLLHSAVDNMVDLALEFGADRDTVMSDMEEILLMEILLDNITISEDRKRDRYQYYHVMSLAELRLRVPAIDWSALFSRMPDLHISNTEIIFNIIDIGYLKRLQDVLRTFSSRTLANYHIYYLATSYVRYLAPRYRDLRRSSYPRRFLKTPDTSTLGLARWEECVDETVALFSWSPILEAYLNRSNITFVENEVQKLFSNVQESATRMLYKSTWMDNQTVFLSKSKLDRTVLEVPNANSTLSKHVELMAEFAKLNFINTSYFDAVVQLNSLRNRFTFLSLRQTDSNALPWTESDASVAINAYYQFDRNTIVLPIAIMQYPLFSPQVPRYLHYSRLGNLAAHEVMHAFDDEGRQYDKYGNLKNWWTNVTEENFRARADCLVEQYCNITEKISDLRLNGKRTLGENFADNGAITLAYDAYLRWKASKNIDDEDRLPGLASFTSMQTFFLSFANIWCESVRPEAMSLFVNEDDHALGKYRVNVPLQNFPAFSEAFNCPAGSPMNPPTKCRIW